MTYIDPYSPEYEDSRCLELLYMPQELIDGSDSKIHITRESKSELRNLLLKIAQCFTKKFHYESAFRYDTDMTSEYEGVLFVEGEKVIGGCAFHLKKKDHNLWSLSWVWLHPDYRGGGRFRKVWNEFLAKREHIWLEGPFSEDMKWFIVDFLQNNSSWKVEGCEKHEDLDVESGGWFLRANES